jgi:ribonucleoside-diphosphate reductase alpha chain
MGLKAVAIYRDNCKVAQPLSHGQERGLRRKLRSRRQASCRSRRSAQRQDHRPRAPSSRELPKRVRNSKTYEFKVADLKGYFTVGEYEDGTPGELFINVSKQGSTLSG